MKAKISKARSQLKRTLFCRAGQHDFVIEAAVVQGHVLRYANMNPANIVASLRCRYCPDKRERMYRTQVILQKPKEL